MTKVEQISQTDATSERLRTFVERIERLIPERKGIADDIKDVYAEAKSAGFDPTLMRQIIKLRAMSDQDRQEQEELLAIYMRAVGMSLEGAVAQAALRSVS